MSNVVNIADYRPKEKPDFMNGKGLEPKDRRVLNNIAIVFGALLILPKGERHERAFLKIMSKHFFSGKIPNAAIERMIAYIEKHKRSLERKIGKPVEFDFTDRRSCRKVRKKIEALCEA